MDHWVVCDGCGEEGWEAHSDSDDADKLCDACGFNMACLHENTELQYDDDAHWTGCTDCGQRVFNPKPHSFDDGLYYRDSDKHYPECDGCDYHQSDGEVHIDANDNGECDVCLTGILPTLPDDTAPARSLY